MEKTMARAIYKRMEVGKQYTTRNLFRLLSEAEYYSYIPTEMQGKDVRKIISSEMWKTVEAGYVKTFTEQESLPNVRGLRFDARPNSFTTYTTRYWVRQR